MKTLWLVALLGCPGSALAHGADEDDDGWIDEVDCDDGDPEVFPGAEEQCDDRDNDCDEEVDEEPCDEGCLGRWWRQRQDQSWVLLLGFGAWRVRRLD